MKKKVSIVIPSLRGGGAEKVMINIMSKLDRNKFDIVLILLKKEGPYIDLIPEDIFVIDLNSNRARSSVFKLLKELNKNRPNIILSTLGYLNLILLSIKPLLLWRPKIIVREANTPSKDMEGLSNIKKFLFKRLYRHLYKKADTVIAQCEDMKSDMINYLGVSGENIECIFNPLDIEKIKYLKKINNPYSENVINLIAIGRLEYQKGFDNLIRAFEIVNKNNKNTHLTILGEGSLKKELQNLINELNLNDKISLVSFKKNPYPYYYYSDMYILSSRWEGFPNTLLEALACETKVLSFDCKSGPREILDNGEYGILIKKEDFNDLAEGIIRYLNEPNKTGSRASKYSIENIVMEYEKVLINL